MEYQEFIALLEQYPVLNGPKSENTGSVQTPTAALGVVKLSICGLQPGPCARHSVTVGCPFRH
jgi:hypothetical protein